MEQIIEPALGFVKNVVGLEENKHTLIKKKEEVRARESDVKSILQTLEEQGKLPTEEVKLWLRNLEQFQGEVSDILNQISSSNYWSYWRLAQPVFAKIEEADSILEKGKFPNGLVIERPSHGKAILFEPPSFRGQSTAEKTIGRIMELLMNPEIGKIGVYGMGGVGKTTIMQIINNKLAATKQFGRIIWVTVSKDMGSIKSVQNKIAHDLGINFNEGEAEVKRAGALLEKLKQVNKKFLLILDDLWNEITLEEIGIPDPNREDNQFCKIVVTTRLLWVCDFIETQVNVEVECLSKNEAWELFVQKAGEHVARVSEIQALAREVVRECSGLPLAIITVGRAMRRKRNVREWAQTLKELRSSRAEIRGMEDKVFKFLRFSYDHLKEEVKKCFLYCAFFPEDHRILAWELIQYWIVEGYMREKGRYLMENNKRGRLEVEHGDRWNWEGEFDKGVKILQELKDACMLEVVHKKIQREETPEVEFFKMHDLIRDMAINIMRRDLGYISSAGLELREWPALAAKISLLYTKIKTLPDQLKCPNLSTLLLRIFDRVEVPRLFFSQMPALQVLDLSENYMTELPASLSNLCNLRALFLVGISTSKIPSLARLKELRVLNLCRSRIEELPEGMEELVNLIYLDLSYTEKLKNLRSNFISRLTCLQVLNMVGCYMEFFNSNILQTFEPCLKEIGSLKQLTTLGMTFKGFSVYQKAMEHIQWDALNNFCITASFPYLLIVANYGNFMSCKVERLLWSSCIQQSLMPPIISKMNIVEISRSDLSSLVSSFCLPGKTQVFKIFNSQIPRLSAFRCLKTLRRLKCLIISNCDINVDLWGDCLVLGDEIEPNAFSVLELKLFNIMKLQVLWNIGTAPNGVNFCTNLKIMKVFKCGSLRTLFSYGILQHLKNLEELIVSDCRKIEKIEGPIDGDQSLLDDTGNIIVVPKLRKLILCWLSELHCVSEKAWTCDSLETLVVFQCPRLDKLPFHNFLSCGKIWGNVEWWEALLWDNAEIKTLLEPCFQSSVGYVVQKLIEDELQF